MSRRWLTALAMAALFAVGCYFLGQWQWHRHEDKAARADRIERHYKATPVPLSRVMPRPGADLPRALEWTRVTATGRYAATDAMLVRNRPNNGVFGYEVAVPLRLTNGSALLVDRGWIPNGRTAAEPSRPPATPAGEVTVTGWLRLGEPSLGREPPSGQLASVNLDEASQSMAQSNPGNHPLYGAYLIARTETGAPGVKIQRAQALAPPDTGQGPHLAYAFQWWLAAPVGFVLILVGARREHLDNLEEAATPAGARTIGHTVGETVGPPVPARLVKVRKTRIWDEEDE
jgi:cytochrome oxidase assembly protein ShyY1